MRTLAAITLVLALTASGCKTANVLGPSERSISLEESTTKIEGWYYYNGGEIWIFPSKWTEAYDPYGPEWLRCISVIVQNSDTKMKININKIGTRMSITGTAKRYLDLKTGTTPYEVLLDRRYYEGIPVINGCNREFVFVAEKFSVE